MMKQQQEDEGLPAKFKRQEGPWSLPALLGNCINLEMSTYGLLSYLFKQLLVAFLLFIARGIPS